jgi:hypothetical protein
MVLHMRPFGFAAALLLSVPTQIGAQPAPAPAQMGAQPTQIELEAALLAHHVRIVTFPMRCRNGPARGCMKPPKAVKVRNYDCQARDAEVAGGPILFCRVTYIQSGGSLAHVQSIDECLPLRSREWDSAEGGGPRLAWEVALVDAAGRCPGGRA